MAIESLKTPVYTSLNPSLKEIRLLHLPPGGEDDEFHCTLSIVSLDDKPQYEALSYVWGEDLEDTLPILLQENTVHIRRNLHSALKGIRYPDCERVLWIDALCIDQKSPEEVYSKATRNPAHHQLIICVAQVAIMGDIYSEADCVLAYIGEDFDGCDRVMEIMSYVSENYKMHFDGPDDKILRIHGVPIIKGGIPWALVYQFFETPW